MKKSKKLIEPYIRKKEEMISTFQKLQQNHTFTINFLDFFRAESIVAFFTTGLRLPLMQAIVRHVPVPTIPLHRAAKYDVNTLTMKIN